MSALSKIHNPECKTCSKIVNCENKNIWRKKKLCQHKTLSATGRTYTTLERQCRTQANKS